MAKILKHRNREVTPQGKTDIAELVIKMQQQLVSLENKIDTLVGRSSARPVEEKQHARPFQRPDHPPRQREFKQNNNYRERTLHKAICADCSKECEVPFRPTGDRPVYCRECFAKRKSGGPFNQKRDNRHVEVKPVHLDSVVNVQKGAMRKFGEKKVKSSKKRKKRS